MVMRIHMPRIRQQGRHPRLRFWTPGDRIRLRNARPQFEGLESRCLLSVTIKEFAIPTANSLPEAITTGPDGNLWFTESKTDKIGEINPTTHAIAEFRTPTANSEPIGITAGPDGNLWFVETRVGKVGEINPTTHAIAEFPLPTANSIPLGITAGPDGNLWFTERDKIGQINISTHVITEFPTPTAGSAPTAITAGADGNLWFSENQVNQIGQINPTTHAIAEFAIPTGGGGPQGITAGPDGNIWFAKANGDIGQINPTTHVIADFPVPSASSEPTFITAGSDGNLWFTELLGNNIGQINPTTHAIAEFAVPTARSNSIAITAGPDGNVWFTEAFGNNIGEAVLPPPANAPDLALSGTAPGSGTAGTKLTYTLTVTNNGTAEATGVKLTSALSGAATFVSATGGVTPVNGMLTFLLGNLAAGALTTVTIVVTPTAAGMLTNSAMVSMDHTDPTPGDNSFTGTTVVMSIRRMGFHAQPTTVELGFGEPVDPAWAQNLHNYQLVVLSGSHRTIHIKSASYDAATRTVTLRPVHRLNLHNLFRLKVVGPGTSGLTSASDDLANGPKTAGDPASSFVTIISAADLELRTKNPAILRKYDEILLEQSAELRRLQTR
jgi:virginiamycin B lyase